MILVLRRNHLFKFVIYNIEYITCSIYESEGNKKMNNIIKTLMRLIVIIGRTTDKASKIEPQKNRRKKTSEEKFGIIFSLIFCTIIGLFVMTVADLKIIGLLIISIAIFVNLSEIFS